jgi:hypothetical protein
LPMTAAAASFKCVHWLPGKAQLGDQAVASAAAAAAAAVSVYRRGV